MIDYKTDTGLLTHLQKQAGTIDQYQTEAGANAAEVAAIKEDYANLAWILNYCSLVDELKITAFGIKRMFAHGEKGASLGDFVNAPSVQIPFAPLSSGVEKRSRERDGRFKRAATMTQAARFGLDLIDETISEAADLIVPGIQLSPAPMNYEFVAVTKNRGKSDMTDVQIRRMGEETWTTVKSGTGKSINVVIEPREAGKAEKIEVRVILRRRNESYGQPSAPAYVTVNP